MYDVVPLGAKHKSFKFQFKKIVFLSYAKVRSQIVPLSDFFMDRKLLTGHA